MNATLEQMQALAAQVRSEVDATIAAAQEDRFDTSTYRGARGFKRQQRAKIEPKKRWAGIRRHNLSLAEPGEMLLGDWLKEQCRLLGHDRSWVLHRFNKGEFPNVTARRVNLRLVFVKVRAAQAIVLTTDKS